jgi:hypothetical protein
MVHNAHRQFFFGRKVVLHRAGTQVSKLGNLRHGGGVDAFSGRDLTACLDEKLPVLASPRLASRFSHCHGPGHSSRPRLEPLVARMQRRAR